MNKSWKAGVLLAFSLVTPLYAQEAPVTAPTTTEQPQTVVIIQSAILTVDPDRLFTGSMYGKRIQEEYIQAQQALAAENRAKEAELAAEEKDLTERRPKLSREEFAKLAEAFDAKAQQIRAEQAQKRADIAQIPEQARQQFLRIVQDVLIEIMREKRALAILNLDSMFLHADSINITDDAIARIDSLIGDGAN